MADSVVCEIRTVYFTKRQRSRGNSRQIANAHTTFNVVCTLVWLPLIPLMVKIVTTIIPGKDKKIKAAYEPKYLDNKMIDQPVAAMYLVSQELENLAGFAATMLTQL